MGGWDIRGRWFGVVVGATPRTGELPRGETIPWRVIGARIAPRDRRCADPLEHAVTGGNTGPLLRHDCEFWGFSRAQSIFRRHHGDPE